VPLLRWNHRCLFSFRVVVDPILQHVFRREAPDSNRKQLYQEELPILATHGSVVTGLRHDCDHRQRNWKAKFMAFFSLRLTASCLKKAVLASGLLLISAQGMRLQTARSSCTRVTRMHVKSRNPSPRSYFAKVESKKVKSKLITSRDSFRESRAVSFGPLHLRAGDLRARPSPSYPSAGSTPRPVTHLTPRLSHVTPDTPVVPSSIGQKCLT
jgi:hypothetical protein